MDYFILLIESVENILQKLHESTILLTDNVLFMQHF